ncbi:hypothetical protein M0R45_019033 [Rubus argutus]|uniref:CCHC-type domain-containing protein n=1 Tax=Rubus argutus TaxID=59490 RepID=A0AAW1X6T1_RUBAR
MNVSWRDTLVLSQHGKNEVTCTKFDLNSLDEEYGLDDNLDTITREYEGLPDICFKCGLYGHKKEHCIHDEVGNKGPENGNNDTDEQAVNVHTAPPSTQEPTEDIPRGAWMQVQPRRRPRKQEK